MGRTLKLEHTKLQKQELKTGFGNVLNHSFRERCQMVFLKSEGIVLISKLKLTKKAIILQINRENKLSTYVDKVHLA